MLRCSVVRTGVESVQSSANPYTCLTCSKRFLWAFFAGMFSVPIALDGALATARRIWVEMARLQAIPRTPRLLLLLSAFSSSDSSESEIDFVVHVFFGDEVMTGITGMIVGFSKALIKSK